MKTFIIILALASLLAPVLTQCPAGCVCASGSTCDSCLAGYRYTAVAGTTPATCTICAEGTGHPASSTPATSCSITMCHPYCATCSATGTDSMNNCAICRDGMYLSNTPAGQCSWCSPGKGRPRLTGLMAAPATEQSTVCTVDCNPMAGCCRCKNNMIDGCINCAGGFYWTGMGKCAACTDGKGKDLDTPVGYWSAAGKTKDESCTTPCTGSGNCGTCTKTNPSTCLACASGRTLSNAMCVSSMMNSATIIQALCGALLAFYAMF